MARWLLIATFCLWLGCCAAPRTGPQDSRNEGGQTVQKSSSDVAGLMAKFENMKTTDIDPVSYAIQSGTTLGMLALTLAGWYVMRLAFRRNGRNGKAVTRGT